MKPGDRVRDAAYPNDVIFLARITQDLTMLRCSDGSDRPVKRCVVTPCVEMTPERIGMLEGVLAWLNVCSDEVSPQKIEVRAMLAEARGEVKA